MKSWETETFHKILKIIFNAYEWKMDFMLCMNEKVIEPFIMQVLKRSLMQIHFNMNAKLFLMHKNNDDAWMYERWKWMQWKNDINLKPMREHMKFSYPFRSNGFTCGGERNSSIHYTSKVVIRDYNMIYK